MEFSHEFSIISQSKIKRRCLIWCRLTYKVSFIDCALRWLRRVSEITSHVIIKKDIIEEFKEWLKDIENNVLKNRQMIQFDLMNSYQWTSFLSLTFFVTSGSHTLVETQAETDKTYNGCDNRLVRVGLSQTLNLSNLNAYHIFLSVEWIHSVSDWNTNLPLAALSKFI